MLVVVGGEKSGKTIVARYLLPYLLRERFRRKIRVVYVSLSHLLSSPDLHCSSSDRKAEILLLAVFESLLSCITSQKKK